MSERVAMDSDLLDRVSRRLCRQGGATWPTKATPYAEAQRNAYQQLAWAAVDEVLTWQSEQAVAAAGPDPFLEIAFPGAVPNGDGTFRVKKPSMSGSIQPSSQPIPEDRQLKVEFSDG